MDEPTIYSHENMDIPIFDQVETYTNCTVQVLTNSITGEVSVGWWQNETEEST